MQLGSGCSSPLGVSQINGAAGVLDIIGTGRRCVGPVTTRYGPGRGPWHVLWGLKEARPLGEALRARRATQAHANPHLNNTLLKG